MAARDEAKKDWEQGMKRKEIAEKYGVSENTVKSWISRHWSKDKGAKKGAPTKPKKGAPKSNGKIGNKNAVGNNGGAPLRNDNAKIHGGYSEIYWDTITDEEKKLKDTMPTDDETLLIEQIRMYSIRERRVLKAIEEMKSKKGGQVLSSVFRSEEKRSFKTKEDEELYNEIQAQKVADEKILPGETYHLNTSTESVGNRIERLEQELTRIQNAKTKAIATLSKINIEKEKLSLIREKDDIEVEDTEETDGVIYGKDLP